MTGVPDFFSGERKPIVLVGLLCIVLISSILLADGVTNKDYLKKDAVAYNAEELLKFRTESAGDNVKVVKIMNNLPYGGSIKQVALQTKTKPYGVMVNYEFKNSETSQQQLEEQFYSNAAIAFALIQNADELSFKLSPSEKIFRYTRQELRKDMNVDLWTCSQEFKTFEGFLQDLEFGVYASPLKYSLTMSSTPGIKIIELYQGDDSIEKVRYTTEMGSFSTWEPPAGKVSKEGRTTELPRGKGIYWTPISAGGVSEQNKENTVTVTLLDEAGKVVRSREIKIKINGINCEVLRGPGIVIGDNSKLQEHITLEDAVKNTILAQSSSYKMGETVAEGHVILSQREMGDIIKVYSIVSMGHFGFENGVFTKISGSGAIPTVITLSNKEENKYKLLEYKEPIDGSGYSKSIKEMFPIALRNDALNAHKYNQELEKQQELQAEEYLKSINRTAKVSAKSVEKVLADIKAEASNKLFAGINKYDAFINACPYWLGTLEQVEDGIRYIYSTSQEKTDDGNDMIIFKKTKEGGTVIKQAKFKIVGSEIQQIE